MAIKRKGTEFEFTLGVRRVKPACCRGGRIPTGKEKATPS